MRFQSWLRANPLPWSLARVLFTPVRERRNKPAAAGRFRKVCLEILEDRTLPAVNLVGIPDWMELGPAPIQGGQADTDNSYGDEVVGAVNAIAIDPIKPGRAYVGSTNGGIWRTDNLKDLDSVWWYPVTDQQPSLSIDSLAISPLDNRVVYAGIGRTSSSFGTSSTLQGDGGNLTGILLSRDSGDTWQDLGSQPFSSTVNPDGTTMKPGGLGGLNIRSIVPTPVSTDGSVDKQIVLAGTDNGVFLSLDGGQTWTDESDRPFSGLAPGNISELVVDPGFGPGSHTVILYAAVPTKGVFRAFLTQPPTPLDPATPVLPLVWSLVGGPGVFDGAPTYAGITSVAATTRIRLAVHDAADGTGLYAVLIQQTGIGQQMVGIFASFDSGQSWKFLGIPGQPGPGSQADPGGQGNIHDAIVADPNNRALVYVAGDRRADDGDLDSDEPEGTVFLGVFDFSTNTQTSWTSLAGYDDGDPVDGRPHADARALVFGGSELYDANDGGLYRLNNPTLDPNGDDPSWASLNHSLRISEFYAVAFLQSEDGNKVVGAAQDNGVDIQPDVGATVWEQQRTGDGFGVQVTGDKIYSTTNGGLEVSGSSRELEVTNIDGDPSLQNVDPAAMANGKNGILAPVPFAVNPLDEDRMLIGTGRLYESKDQGEELDDLGAMGEPTGSGDPVYGFTPITAIAYGGIVDGVATPDLIYVAAAAAAPPLPPSPPLLWRRDDIHNDFILLPYPGTANIRKIALDPSNAKIAYVIETDGTVWETFNKGMTWANLTGNLASFTTDLRSLAVVQTSPNVLLVGAGQGSAASGGVYRLINPGVGVPVWSLYGHNFPNVLTTDLHSYTNTTDSDPPTQTTFVLAGTFGRGAMGLYFVENSATTPGLVDVEGDDNVNQPNDNITLSLDPKNPLLLDISLNGSTQVVPVAAISSIQVNGGTGADTLTVDFSNGVFNPPGGINFDGGTESDTLFVFDNSSALYTPKGGGDGTFFVNNVPITFQNLAPVIVNGVATFTLITPSSSNNLTLDTPGSGQLRVSGSSDGVEFENASVGPTTAKVTLDLATNDDASAQDSISASAAAFLAVPTTNFELKTGPNKPGNTFTLDAQGHDVILTANTIQVVGAGSLSYDTLGTIVLNNAGNVMVQGTPGADLKLNGDTTLTTEAGVSVIKVTGASGHLRLVIGGEDDVTLAPLQNFLGPVTITYSPGGTAILHLDDSTDVTARTGTLTNIVPQEDPVPYGRITGLAPASITFEWAGTQELRIVTGKQNDTVNVLSTSSSVFLDSSGGADNVYVGGIASASGATGGEGTLSFPASVQHILGPVSVANSHGRTNLTVDDSFDAIGRVGKIYSSSIALLAPQPIRYRGSELASLTVRGGSGGNTFYVDSTPGPVSPALGGNACNVYLYAGAGHDLIEVGDLQLNRLDGILGPLSISGQDGADALDINDQGNKLGHTYTLTSGAGSTLDRSGAAPITYDGKTETVTIKGSRGSDTWTVKTPPPVLPVTFVGQGAQNTLVGPNVPNTVWQIRGADAGQLGQVTFQGMSTLLGGGSSNTFRFTSDGSISRSIQGGSNAGNLLNYGANSAAVTVDLLQHSASRIRGGTADGFSQINGLVGSSAADVLVGDSSNHLWQLTGPDQGAVNGFQFTSVENLRGGSGIDTFQFAKAGSKLSGTIDGGSRGDWLDYSKLKAPVTVNLSMATASLVAGGVSRIQHVIGGAGANDLTGDAVGSILIGGAGANALTAGSGRSLLIGGTGVSTLRAGPADSILIAGITLYNANEAALMAILKEWQRTDLAGTALQQYQQRLNHLRHGTGYTKGARLIWGATVLDTDKPGARLYHGTGGLDWYFLSHDDVLSGFLHGKEKRNNEL